MQSGSQAVAVGWPLMLTLVETVSPLGPAGASAGVGAAGAGIGAWGKICDGMFTMVCWVTGADPQQPRCLWQPPLTVTSRSEVIGSREEAGVVFSMEDAKCSGCATRDELWSRGVDAWGHRAARHPRDASWVILGRMKHALLALALSGCVTTAGVTRHNDVGLPLLVGAVVADVLVTSVAASQIQDYSYGGSIATGLALTAVDVAAACLLGACAALHP